MNNLEGKTIIVTGGKGLLGSQYMEAIKELKGYPVSLDIRLDYKDEFLDKEQGHLKCNIADVQEVERALKYIKSDDKNKNRTIYGLINNAAINPKFEGKPDSFPYLEEYPLDSWKNELDIGLTGALICTKIFGREMIKNREGSIINISSLLGVVAPNQNFYAELNAVKPVGYTIIKHAIIGLTRHTATEWAKYNIRCNALAPNGVFNNHSEDFVQKLIKYIPLGRMARKEEYNEAIKFLLTDGSSFMTGHTLVIDGGHSIW